MIARPTLARLLVALAAAQAPWAGAVDVRFGRVADNVCFEGQGAGLIAHRTAVPHMRSRAVEQGGDVSETVRSFDARPFQHLSSAAELNPGNASRTCLEVERE